MEGATGYLGPAVMIVIAAIGGIVAWASLRATFVAFSAETSRRFNDSETDRKDLRSRIDQVDRASVKREDFARFDDKVGSRFEKLEHAVNNSALKTAQVVKEAIRDMLPPRSGA